MYDDVHRTGIFQETVRDVGDIGACRRCCRRHTDGYSRQNTAQHSGTSPFRNVAESGFFEKEEVPAAKFDIDKDAQIAHARIAIATSHVVGKGPGNSIQRDFLSQAFSDFIFAIVIEEMGLVGGIFVVFLYLWLLMRAGRIAQKCERTFPAFLVMGIALLLVSQAILNMMVAVGLFPVTGQPLPLVSKGGTSTLINCAYIGMILSVSRYTAHLEEQKAHDAQIQLQIEADAAANSEAQAAAEPTAQILNSDAKFEDEHDSRNNER